MIKKEKKFKCITVNLSNTTNIIDVEEIKALDLNEATKLASAIQIAELKQNNKPILSSIEKYNVIFSQRVGVVPSEKTFIILVLGEDNEWYQYLKLNAKWNCIIELEWQDYVQEVIRINSTL
jgi:hypothetical protein